MRGLNPRSDRALGIREATYYVWRKRYGQMAIAEIRATAAEQGFCSRYVARWTAHVSAHRRGQLESPQSIHRDGFRPHREQGGNSARTSGQAALRITALRVAATNTATSQLRSYPWRVNKRKSLPILLNRQSCAGTDVEAVRSGFLNLTCFLTTFESYRIRKFRRVISMYSR
jgi:hypothetical protein